MCLPHWGNTLLCDKGFIEQGAPGRVEGSRDATKKISYIAVYGHSKLEYKALVWSPGRQGEGSKNQKHSKELHTRCGAPCVTAELYPHMCQKRFWMNSISSNVIMPIYEISVMVIIPIPCGNGLYCNRIIFITPLLICAVYSASTPAGLNVTGSF